MAQYRERFLPVISEQHQNLQQEGIRDSTIAAQNPESAILPDREGKRRSWEHKLRPTLAIYQLRLQTYVHIRDVESNVSEALQNQEKGQIEDVT